MMYPLSIFCWTQQFEEAQELVEELYSVPVGQVGSVGAGGGANYFAEIPRSSRGMTLFC
jgi:hypothetical protein